MQSRLALVTLIAVGLFSTGSTLFATPYSIGGGSVSGLPSDPGLVIQSQIVFSAPLNFNLNDGESFTFDFFNIWTNETTINADDTAPMPISATMNFLDPSTGATVNGVTFGASLFLGFFEWGRVEWNGPITIDTGDRVFQIALSDETFNFGIFGTFPGEGHGATVQATITQISHHSVPEGGSSAVLLGLSLLGLAAGGRYCMAAGRTGMNPTLIN